MVAAHFLSDTLMAFSGAHHFNINEAHLYDHSTKSGLNGIQYLAQNIASDATHDSVKGFNRGTCHPGTRTDIMQNILNWANSDFVQKKIYWLHGSAGVGKSVIAQTVAVSLEKEGKLGASFFFSRTDPTRNNVSKLFSTIAYKLSISLRSKDLRQAVESQIELDPSVVTQSMEIQWSKLIVEPFKSATTGNKTVPISVVIIDGLDECEELEHQLDLLQILDETGLEDLPLRIVVSSRPEAHIRDSMLEGKAIKHELLRSSQVDEEIRLFFSDKFKELCKQRKFRTAIQSAGCNWPSNDDLTTLVAKASGQYIYAKTVLRYVELGREGTPVMRLRQIISHENTHEAFSELDVLYHEILSKCPQVTLTVIGFLYIILRRKKYILTPTLSVIDQLLRPEPGVLDAVLDTLHSLIYIPDLCLLSTWELGEPYFHHASLEDFLTDRQRSGKYFIEMNLMQEHFLKCCEDSMELIFGDAHVHQPSDGSSEHFSFGTFYALSTCFDSLGTRRVIPETRLKDLTLKLLDDLNFVEFSETSRKKQLELCCSLETLLIIISTIGGHFLVKCNQTLMLQVDKSRLGLFSEILDLAVCNPYISAQLKIQLLRFTGWLLEYHCIVSSVYQFQGTVLWNSKPSFRGSYAEFFCGVVTCHKVCQKRYIRNFRGNQKEVSPKYKFSPHEIFVVRHFGCPTLLPFYGIEISRDINRHPTEIVWPISPFMPYQMTHDLKMTSKEKLLLISDAIGALEYLHAEGIIPGYIIPRHILISSNRRGYLSTTHDWLYSEKLFGNADVEEHKTYFDRMPGPVLRYTAPECLRLNSGNDADEDIVITDKVNIYLLSMIIYEILTHLVPFFEHDSRLTICDMIRRGEIPSFPSKEDKCWVANGGLLTNDIANLLVECWDRDPTKRPSLEEIYTRMHLGDIEDTRPADDWPLAARFNDLKHSAQFVAPEAIEDMFAMVREAISDEEKQ